MKRKFGRFTRQALAGVCALSMMMSNFTFAYAQEDYTAPAEEVVVEQTVEIPDEIISETFSDDCCCDDCCEHEHEHEDEHVEEATEQVIAQEEVEEETATENDAASAPAEETTDESEEESVITETPVETPEEEVPIEAPKKLMGAFKAPTGECPKGGDHKYLSGWMYNIKHAATCTEDGYTESYCDKCDQWINHDIVPATGHDLSSYLTSVTEPTCTEGGYTRSFCFNCYKYVTHDETPALGHDYNGKVTERREATCTKDGSYKVQCTRCREKETKTIPALGHDFNGKVSERHEATCTKDGSYKVQCTRCKEKETKTILALGHDFNGTVSERREATCTEDGSYKVQCTRCSEKETKTITALGHLWDDGTVTTPATYDKDGVKTYKCTRQGCNETKTEVIPKLVCENHNYVVDASKSKAATCQEDGLEVKVCSNCGDTVKTDLPKVNHNFTNLVGRAEPWCEREGYKLYQCEWCSETERRDIVPATGHIPEDVDEVPATCEENGHKAGTKCSDCGKILSGCEEIPAPGHDWQDVRERKATCVDDGHSAYKRCLKCEAKEGYVFYKATGHNYSQDIVVVTEPTCTTNGVRGRVCSKCGWVKDADVLNKKGHDFSIDVPEQKATCTEDGHTAYKKCSRCEETKGYEVIKATGHDMTEIIDTYYTPDGADKHKKYNVVGCSICHKAPNEHVLVGVENCTGKTTSSFSKPIIGDYENHTLVEKQKCEFCNRELPDKETPVNHDFKLQSSTEATCTTKGVEIYTCSLCHYNKVVESDPLNHDFSIDVPEQKATCTEDGHSAYKKCSHCDATEGYEVYKAEGHDMTKLLETEYNQLNPGVHEVVKIYGCQNCDDYGKPSKVTTTEDCNLRVVTSKYANLNDMAHRRYWKQVCDNCGYESYEKYIDEAHVLDHHDGQAATCTENGWEAYDTCKHCDYTSYKEIPAPGHDMTKVICEDYTKDPNHPTHEHYREYGCQNCNDYGRPLTDRELEDCIPKCIGTTYDKLDDTKHVTIKNYECELCRGKLDQERTEEEHDLQFVEHIDATCEKEGYDLYQCTKCKTYVSKNIVDKLDHDFENGTEVAGTRVDPTCTEDGSCLVKCANCEETQTRTIAKLEHDLIPHAAQAPTCTEIGWNAYDTCSRCDYSTYVEIEPTGHDFENGTEIERVNPTCTEDGYYVMKCANCTKTDTIVLKATGEHVYDDWYVANEATCQHTGLQRRDCKNCSHYEEEVIPMEKNHKYVKKETIAPTCTEEGYDLALCQWCNKERHQHKVEPLGHDVIHHAAQAPTCIEIGWEAYDTCSRCDYSTYVEIEPTGHDFENGTEIKRVEPTCTKDGYYVIKCANCNETQTHTLNKLGHKYGEWYTTKEPTCTELGYERHDCKNEGCNSYQSRAINKLGHNLIDVPKKDSTCLEDGYEAYKKCSRCEYTEGYEVIPAKGHDFENGTEIKRVEPTCTKDGYYVMQCSRCNATETYTLNATGHKYGEWYTSKEPTCTELGYERHDCKNEGCNSYQSRAINKLGHNLIDVPKKDATCLEDGHTAYKKCSRCEYTEGYEVINAIPHNYGEWYITIEPTCTRLGFERHDCKNDGCHYYESHAINKLGHDLIDVPKKDSTCLEDGYEAYKKCSRCEYTEGYEAIPAKGHDLIDVPKKDSTCLEDGYEAYKKCTRCEYTEGYEVIPAKGHDFTVYVKGSDTYESKDKASHTHYWTNKCSRCEETEIEQEVLKHNFVMVDDKKPTCEEKGYTTYKCKECNYKYTAEVSALGHSYGNLTKEIVKAPTTESEGRYEEVKYCERCNDRYVINSGIIPKLEKEEPAPLPAAPAAPAKTDKKPVETKVTETEETVSDVTETSDTEETVTEEIAEEVVPEAAPEITEEEETPEVTKAAAEEPVAETETEKEEPNAFCWWWLLLILIVLIIATSIIIYARRKNNARR